MVYVAIFRTDVVWFCVRFSDPEVSFEISIIIFKELSICCFQILVFEDASFIFSLAKGKIKCNFYMLIFHWKNILQPFAMIHHPRYILWTFTYVFITSIVTYTFNWFLKKIHGLTIMCFLVCIGLMNLELMVDLQQKSLHKSSKCFQSISQLLQVSKCQILR